MLEAPLSLLHACHLTSSTVSSCICMSVANFPWCSGGIIPGEQTCLGAVRWDPRRLQAQMHARLPPGRRPLEQLLPPLHLDPQTSVKAL